MRRIALALIVAAVCAAPCQAQTETPEQVASQIMEAARATDWGRTAALMHPSALHQLREIINPILLMDNAETRQAVQDMFGLANREAAVAASDSAIFTGLLRFAMAQQQGLSDIMRSAQYQILGTVAEGRDTVHVVGRLAMSVRGMNITQMEVISLMRSGTTWRGILKGDYTAMATAMRAALKPDAGK